MLEINSIELVTTMSVGCFAQLHFRLVPTSARFHFYVNNQGMTVQWLSVVQAACGHIATSQAMLEVLSCKMRVKVGAETGGSQFLFRVHFRVIDWPKTFTKSDGTTLEVLLSSSCDMFGLVALVIPLIPELEILIPKGGGATNGRAANDSTES